MPLVKLRSPSHPNYHVIAYVVINEIKKRKKYIGVGESSIES